MNNKKLRMNNTNNGITLIALIITIIILLILAVVSIKIATGDGLISKAQSATKEYSEAQELEKVNLAVTDARLANNGGSITLENLKSALDAQFGSSSYTFSSETLPYKFTINNGTGKMYTVYSDGYVEKTVVIDNEEILAKYPLSGTVSDGVYTFDNDNLTNAYDAILAEYGKTVSTADLLTSMKACKKLTEIYSTQEGLDADALATALAGNYYVEVDGVKSLYSSDFGYLTDAEFNESITLTEEEENSLSSLSYYDKLEAQYKLLFGRNIGYFRHGQMMYAQQVISKLESYKTSDNYYIINDKELLSYDTENDYKSANAFAKALFQGGWINGSVKYETVDKAFNAYTSMVSYIKVYKNLDLSEYMQSFSNMGMAVRVSDDTIEITEENKDEIQDQINGKIIYCAEVYLDESDRYVIYGFVATNVYVMSEDLSIVCYVDSNGNITEGRFN